MPAITLRHVATAALLAVTAVGIRVDAQLPTTKSATTSQSQPQSKLSAQDRAIEMKRQGAKAPQVAAELTKSYGLPHAQAVAVLKGAGYQAAESFDGIMKGAGATSDQAHAATVRAGFSKVDAGQAHYASVRIPINVAQAMGQNGATPYEVMLALHRAGASPIETAKAVQKVHTFTAIHLAAEMQRVGWAVEDVARGMYGAGHNVREIGEGLKAAGYDVVQLAAALKSIGLTIEQTAVELRALSYEFNDIARALSKQWGMAVAPIAGALMAAGAGAENSARALQSIGITLQISASALRAAGYTYMAIGQAFIAMGVTIQQAATVLKAAGFAMQEIALFTVEASGSPVAAALVLRQVGLSAGEVAAVMKQSYGQTANVAAATLEEVGYDATQVFGALREHFALSAELAFKRVLELYGSDAAYQALKSSGIGDSQAVKFAKQAGERAAAIAKGIRQNYPVGGDRVTSLLVTNGFPVNETAAAVVSAFNASALDLAKWLKDASQSQSAVLQALSGQFKSMSAMELQQIVDQVFGG